MLTLECDICNGKLQMSLDGESAVCEVCGIIYSKERLKIKAQKINILTVSIKEEMEKDRLIKNAETFCKLGDIEKAKSTCQKLLDEYPDDWRGYLGFAKIEYAKMLLDSRNVNGGPAIYEFQRKATLLNPNCAREFDKLRDEYEIASTKQKHTMLTEIIDLIQNGGGLCFDKIGLIGNAYSEPFYNTVDCAEAFEQLDKNAQSLIDLIKYRNKLKRLNNLLNIKVRIDSNVTGYINGTEKFIPYKPIINMNRHATKLDIIRDKIELCSDWSDYLGELINIVDVVFLSPMETIVEGKFSNREKTFSKLLYIVFDKSYSVEELASVLIGTTDDE